MQPRPMAETSRPLFPSLRFRIVLSSLSSFVENPLRDRQRGIRGRPARVEGQMRDDLDQLIPADAVFESLLQVKGQLVRPVERDEACDGNQAPVARRQARPLPYLAEQHLVGNIRERGRDVTERLARYIGFI